MHFATVEDSRNGHGYCIGLIRVYYILPHEKEDESGRPIKVQGRYLCQICDVNDCVHVSVGKKRLENVKLEK